MSTTTPRQIDAGLDTGGAVEHPQHLKAWGVPAPLAHLWADRRLAAAVALGVPALLAVAVGLLIPRGPATTAATLAVMLLASAAGVVAGLALASRWAVLAAPLVHVAVLEAVRLPVVGPTVDGITLSGWVGIGAFVFGRGWYGLVALLPMVVTATWGAAASRRMRGVGQPSARRRRKVLRHARRGVAALATVAVLALAVLVARPASTAPILGPDGEPLPGSIAELTDVEVGGHAQTLMIRGHDVTNPVLLYLVGGPGGSQLGHVRATMSALEEDFVLVTWEQRGTGKSYAALDPAGTHTLAQAVADTVAVTEHLRERFGAEQVYLVANSWGTIPGLLAAQQRPELYAAYVGAAQMVNLAQTDRRFHTDLLAHAERTGNTALVSELRSYGEPPYADVRSGQSVALHYTAELMPAFDLGLPGIEGLGTAEYSLVDKRNVVAGLLDTYAVMYPQLQELDFRRDVVRLDVPVYIVQGGLEAPGRDDLAREWYASVQAPRKQLVTLPSAAHSPNYEDPAGFRRVMRQVLTETGEAPPA
jgi:proline iminopeptidase